MNPAFTPGISIVIAVRNEITFIQDLVNSLSVIVYPKDKFEVIIVNDHSTDDTWLKVKELIVNVSNIKLIDLVEGEQGKKAALRFGISNAQFEIIATTDADCSFSKNWIKCLSMQFEQNETKMVIGAVKLMDDGSFFSSLQVTEFISLIGSAAASIGLSHPIMCNGANLAFRKNVFDEVGGYDDNMSVASGDDEFLMRKIYKRYPSGIRFLNFYEGVVTSNTQKTFRDFFYQRLRWAGKWKHNTDQLTQLLAVFIFVSQIAFIALIVENINYPDVSLGLVIGKLFLEAIFLLWVGHFLERRFDVLAFLALQILHPLYVIGVGSISIIASYQWKNRNYK